MGSNREIPSDDEINQDKIESKQMDYEKLELVDSQPDNEDTRVEKEFEQPSDINKTLESEEQQSKGAKSEEGEKVEQKERPIITVADFLDYYEQKANDHENNNQEEKGLMSTQAVKIRLAMSAAGLSPADVYVENMPDGVLGLFDIHTKKISLSISLLEEEKQQLIRTAAVHERIHKLKKIYDEGLTQIAASKITSVTPGIYEVQQAEVRRTFYKIGINKTLELYDLERPDDLFKFYLQKGLECRYGDQKEKLKSFIGGNFFSRGIAWVKRDIEAKNIAEKEITSFKKSVPELYEKLKMSGYDIKKNVRDAIEGYAKGKIKNINS